MFGTLLQNSNASFSHEDKIRHDEFMSAYLLQLSTTLCICVVFFFNVASIPSAGTHSLTQEMSICSSQHLKMCFPVIINSFLTSVLPCLSPHTRTPPFALLFPSSQNYVATSLFCPQLLDLWWCLPSLGQHHLLSFSLPSKRYRIASHPLPRPPCSLYPYDWADYISFSRGHFSFWWGRMINTLFRN